MVYGFVGLKTHAKLALIVREEADGTLRRYCHLGTGNYHPTTARLLTADPAVGEDVTNLFNHLTGYYVGSGSYRRLLVAPGSMRSEIVERINRERERFIEGNPARIRFKCNALTDERIIEALYDASQAGVPVDLSIRGICALRPGVPGMSETIRVRSILGRFLEHSRLFAFGPGGDDGPPEVFLGAADMTTDKLDRRVEQLVQITEPRMREDLTSLIDLAMDQGTASWWLDGDGIWTRRHIDDSGMPLLDIQSHLIIVRQASSR